MWRPTQAGSSGCCLFSVAVLFLLSSRSLAAVVRAPSFLASASQPSFALTRHMLHLVAEKRPFYSCRPPRPFLLPCLRRLIFFSSSLLSTVAFL